MTNELKTKLDNAPNQPGCYFWKNKNNEIIYVGKAKNIKKRIMQYFTHQHNQRISKLVREINDVDYIIVNNDNDALVLENNLIKTHKPKYNVLLKENSNYPYIILTNEKDPRIIYTRKYNAYKGKAYGPFPSSDINTYEVYNLIQRIIPLRKCNFVPNKKCIYYDLGQCLGPCINNIEQKTYDYWKKEVNNIFQNKTKKILDDLRNKELTCAEKMDFEGAKYYLELQNSLKHLNDKQIVELINNFDIDVIGYYCNDGFVSIIIFNFHEGKLISKNEHLSFFFGTDVEEEIVSYLVQYYSQNKLPKYLYVNLKPEKIKELNDFLEIKVSSSNSQSKYHKIILMAIQNAKKYMIDHKLKSMAEFNRTIGACEELANILKISYPTRIDMIDNSNIFNEIPVSAMITYINGKKATKYYRKFNLDAVNQKSDYHYMVETIKRRYAKIANDNDKPNLLIVDGGVIQIHAALKALNDIGINDINVIGLVKNEKHKTNAIIDINENKIDLDKSSNLYLFLSNIQDEVHRFAITHFREKRIKSQMHSFLDEIQGLGPKTRNKLLTIYPNIWELKNIDEKTIAQIVGNKLAKKIKIKIDKEFKNENINH